MLYEIRMLIYKYTCAYIYKISNQSKNREMIRKQLEDKSRGRG